MIISSVHVIRLSDLHDQWHAPMGGRVRVDLGDTDDVSTEEIWRIRSLIYGASHVQVEGSQPSMCRLVTSLLDENEATL